MNTAKRVFLSFLSHDAYDTASAHGMAVASLSHGGEWVVNYVQCKNCIHV